MYDAIVVGARCAGAPTAMLLARQGHKVLLVDRATFPSEIPHGHFIHKQGPALLHRWGLLDQIVADGCPATRSILHDFGDFPLIGEDLEVAGVAVGYGPRRTALDQILVEAAIAAGVELRTGFTVEEFTTDGERITGIRGRGRDGGATVTEQATVTVGADGRNSRLARTVGAPIYEAVPAVSCYYFSYWSGVPTTSLEVYVRGDRLVVAFPTNDGLTALFVAWPSDELAAVRAEIERHFQAALDRVPELAERVRAGRREERYYGATDLPNFLRKPYGPGWALVGDAGCHKDPFMALGICDAFRDADLLASALGDGLAGRQPLDAALAEYERRRNEATLPEFHQNLALARFAPPPDFLGLRAALRGNQEATNQFFRASEGLIPREAFFNPQNLRKIMSASMTGAR